MKHLAFIAILALAAQAFAAGRADLDLAHAHAGNAIEASPATTATTAAVNRVETKDAFYASGQTGPDAQRPIAAQTPDVVECAKPSRTDGRLDAADDELRRRAVRRRRTRPGRIFRRTIRRP